MKFALVIFCAASAAWAQTATCAASSPTATLPGPSTGFGAGPVSGWDNSGNTLLVPPAAGSIGAGAYYFRYIKYTVGDRQGDLSQAVVLYGEIIFTAGSPGAYSIPAPGELDSNSIPLSPSFPAKMSGKYSIGACGYGFIQNPLSTADVIWGGVGANGVFVGSSTETQGEFNDLFIAAPLTYTYNASTNVPTGPPTLSTLKGSYSVAYLNFPSGLVGDVVTAGFQMTSNGHGGIGAVNIQMYQGNTSSPLDFYETANYFSAGGAEVLNFPDTGYALSGQKYLYITPDGSLIFGGGPNAFDFFVGVQTEGPVTSATATPGFAAGAFSGLFYQAGINELMVPGTTLTGSLQTFWGSFEPVLGTILDHKRFRILMPTAAQAPIPASASCFSFLTSFNCSNPAFSETAAPSYALGFGPNAGYTDASGTQYVLSANGTARLGFGAYPYLGIAIAVQAPAVPMPSSSSTANSTAPSATLSNSCSGSLFVYPNGVVNSASFSPFTSGISPGELITIFGSNLANVNTVYFNGNPTTITPSTVCSQLSVVVPFLSPNSLSVGDSVQIVVSESGQYSNPVWTYMNSTTIGVPSQSSNGLGLAGLTSQNSAIPPACQTSPPFVNPATAGNVVCIEAVGLGSLSGSSTSPSAPLTVTVGGSSATYAAIQPPSGDSGIYYIPVTIPKSLSGIVPVVIGSMDSVAAQTLIDVTAPTAASPSTPTSTTTTITITSPTSAGSPTTTVTTTTAN